MLLEANGHFVNHTGISRTLRILVGLSVRVCVRVCPSCVRTVLGVAVGH